MYLYFSALSYYTREISDSVNCKALIFYKISVSKQWLILFQHFPVYKKKKPFDFQEINSLIISVLFFRICGYYFI